MRRLMAVLLCTVLLLAVSGCGASIVTSDTSSVSLPSAYTHITAETAKEMMDTESGYIILDVRTQEEYDESHIPGALLIPNETIGTDDIPELPDMDQLILVYCRSGNRSQQAASKLVDLGYTNIYEFGGIIDWPYETE